jgi:hypothetical protein
MALVPLLFLSRTGSRTVAHETVAPGLDQLRSLVIATGAVGGNWDGVCPGLAPILSPLFHKKELPLSISEGPIEEPKPSGLRARLVIGKSNND